MRRNEIKADGTVYMAKDGRAWETPVRVVETERLWSYAHNGSYPDTVKLAPTNLKMSASSSNPGTWSRRWTCEGFLVIRAEQGNEDALKTLREFDMTHVLDMPTDKKCDVSSWNAALPEGLSLDVAVTREFLDTWKGYQETKAVERVQYSAEQAQRRMDNERQNQVRADVTAVMKAHGIRETYPGHRSGKVTLNLDAEQFMALLEKLDPQRVLDAVVDHLMDTYDFSPVPERILQEIQGSAEIVRRKIRDEI